MILYDVEFLKITFVVSVKIYFIDLYFYRKFDKTIKTQILRNF